MAKESLSSASAGKRSLLQEKENAAPPKRPKSVEEKTHASEQVQCATGGASYIKRVKKYP